MKAKVFHYSPAKAKLTETVKSVKTVVQGVPKINTPVVNEFVLTESEQTTSPNL